MPAEHGVKAVITLSAPSPDSDEIDVAVDFEPGLDREKPSVLAHFVVCALEALGVGEELLRLEASSGAVGGTGVRSAGG